MSALITASKKKIHIFILCVISHVIFLPAVQATDYIQFNKETLSAVKTSLHKGSAKPLTQKAYQYLLKKADKALSIKNPTVMDKTFYPPSKNKHDYLSLSRYWWPDPKSRNGLPWIQNDGVTNPSTQTDDVDRKRLSVLTDTVRLLSLAYYFSEDEKYAAKASSMLTTWFLDEKTKMNPHLSYAQSVPGNPKGRRSGILDGRSIPGKVLDALSMLSSSTSWTADKNKQMTLWLSEYFSWLTTSKLGKLGAKQTNNHGSWYRFQVTALSWYLGDKTRFVESVSFTKQSIEKQITVNGSQPHELKRTRGYFYSAFNLKALALIANLAEKEQLGLWQHKAETGQSLSLAIDYLVPAAKGEEWPHSSKNMEVAYIATLLRDIAPHYPEGQYKQVLINMLKALQQQDTLSLDEKMILMEFALFSPSYI